MDTKLKKAVQRVRAFLDADPYTVRVPMQMHDVRALVDAVEDRKAPDLSKLTRYDMDTRHNYHSIYPMPRGRWVLLSEVETACILRDGPEAASATVCVDMACAGCISGEGPCISKPAQATPEGADLPPLPDPEGEIFSDGNWLSHARPYRGKFGKVYTADQMRGYAIDYAMQQARAALYAHWQPVHQARANLNGWADVKKPTMERLAKDGVDTRTLYRAASAQHALPERDTTKPAEQQGMFRKFDVRRTDGSDQPGGKHHGCEYFVLDLKHDKHAPAAMAAYAMSCRETHPLLARDIMLEIWGNLP